jgi:hypothetical protein
LKNFKYFLFLAILILLSCHKEKYPFHIADFRPEVRTRLESLASENQLPSTDTAARTFLRNECTKDELLKLLNCDNPLLRIISYRTIVNRNEPDYFQILLNHLDDTNRVTLVDEDVISYDMVSDIMIQKIIYDKKISRIQKDSLINVVLLKATHLDIAYNMILDIKPQEKYYMATKSKAEIDTWDNRQMWMVFALSRYKKQEDIPFLENKLSTCEEGRMDWAFKAIESFPDTTFFKLLKKYLEINIKVKEHFSYAFLQSYCYAVAVYRSNQSASILEELNKDETYFDKSYLLYNKEALFRAIKKYKSPLYTKLYEEIIKQIPGYLINENQTDPAERYW